MKSKQSWIEYYILFLLIILKFILQYAFVNPIYELHRDEFLYLNQAFHPAAGYISVPPFSSWISSIIYLLGGGLFWVRFFPALFGALTIVLAWLIVEEFKGGLPAKILTAILLIFSVYLRINLLFQPNSFEILASTIIFYTLIKYVKTQHPKWIILLAVIVALAVYNKYNILFLIFGLFIGLLLTPQRFIFSKKEFFIAIGLCIVLLLPNIIWQIQNDYPAIHHLYALKEKQLVHISASGFLLDQLKYLMSGVIALVVFGGFFLHKPFKPFRFIGWAFAITIMIYTFTNAKAYYALGLYPVLFAMGSVYWEIILQKRKTTVISIFLVFHITSFLFIAKFFMPIQSPEQIIHNGDIYKKMGMLIWEDGKEHQLPQDFADMIGWKEMALKVSQTYETLSPEEQIKTLILTDNYGQAGALNYYNRNKMPEAYAFSTDYIYWIPRLRKIQNILWVGKQSPDEISDLFEKVEWKNTIDYEYAREEGTKIYLLLNANEELTPLFYDFIDNRIQTFDIF